jgi:p-aminobenzoyl-glutamate transporter AbgT
VAAGIGSLVMGITVNVVEQSVRIKELIGVDFNALFRFDQNFGLGSGVGPLSGKVIVSVLAFLISWAVLFLLWRRRDISVGKAFAATLVLVAIGFALTFPPVFYFLAGE